VFELLTRCDIQIDGQAKERQNALSALFYRHKSEERMESIIFVEDHVVPQLFTTAIEAYDFEHKSSSRAKGLNQLETFGLLWGYSIEPVNKSV
tara:strand:+ start:13739 stop:14017 length:279 start_codon:yes stop_codon:yes gene_type:complete